MGQADFAMMEGLRTRHFPPERNVVPAHISLFHHLPPSRLDDLLRMMRSACAGPPPIARLSDVMLLGRGVGFRVESPDLLAIRGDIAGAFPYELIPQDQHTPRLHITVQNKVTAAEAKALHAQLSAQFRPRPISIIGLAAWHYGWAMAIGSAGKVSGEGTAVALDRARAPTYSPGPAKVAMRSRRAADNVGARYGMAE